MPHPPTREVLVECVQLRWTYSLASFFVSLFLKVRLCGSAPSGVWEDIIIDFQQLTSYVGFWWGKIHVPEEKPLPTGRVKNQQTQPKDDTESKSNLGQEDGRPVSLLLRSLLYPALWESPLQQDPYFCKNFFSLNAHAHQEKAGAINIKRNFTMEKLAKVKMPMLGWYTADDALKLWQCREDQACLVSA